MNMLTKEQIDWLMNKNPGFARLYVCSERVRAEMEANRLMFSQPTAEAPRHGHPDYPRRAALQAVPRGEST